MKKLVSFLLLWALCAACFAVAQAESVEIVQESLHQSYEVDGKVLAELNAVFPQLSGMEDTEAMERINAAIRDYILTGGEYDNICEYALTDYRNSSEKLAESEYGLEANARAELLADGTVLAVRFDFLLETGGPHPWDVIAAQHYFLYSGSPVTLEALLFTPEETLALVAQEAARWIAESGYEAFEDANLSEWKPEQGLLTREGLLVFYNEGEIGPVSSGALEFTIPYALLKEQLPFDLIPLPENPTPEELLQRAELLYGVCEYGRADSLVDRVLKADPNNLDAYLTRAEGYCDLEMGDVDYALELLAEAEPLAEGDAGRRYDRVLAKALHMRASELFDVLHGIHGDRDPGDKGYDVYEEFLRDVERATQLDPTVPAYYYTAYDIAYAMGLYDEGGIAKARGDILNQPEDPQGYLELVYALEGKDLFEEAAEVYARMLALTDPPGTAYAYQEAESLFAAGEYEACLPLYEQAVEEEVYPTLALIHRYDALMGLERYEDAAAASKECGELTGETFLFTCLAAEAYVKLGDVWSARRMLWEVLDVEPEYQRALDIQAAIEKMLPPGAEEAFAEERWDGWDVVATGFYEESPQPYTVVAALRKGEDNVLCVLRRTGGQGAYTIVLENDRALYPGDRTPTIYYEGHVGEMITIVYEVDLGRSIPGYNGFSFYNDEEDDEDRYEFYWAYREIPEPGDDGYTDRYGNFHSTVDFCRYEISENDGALSLTQRWGNPTEVWDNEREFLAEVEGAPGSLALASFDIARCDAMFDSAMEDLYGYKND